jgi:serine/threonine-protein kinase RsbW
VRAGEDTCPVIDAVSDAMSAAGYPHPDLFAVRLALAEALANAVKHGHRGDSTQPVRVSYRVGSAYVTAEVEDRGEGFDPFQVDDPCTPENLERPSGRGLLMMRHLMTCVRFNEQGNCVTLCRCRSDR